MTAPMPRDVDALTDAIEAQNLYHGRHGTTPAGHATAAAILSCLRNHHGYALTRREPLDVEVLARALINGLLPLRHWFMDGETTTENFARWLAAEYARLEAER